MLGMVFLPRTIDKARAFRKKALGEYIYPCPLDKMVLNFFQVQPEVFAEKSEKSTDLEIEAWLKEKIGPKKKEQIDFINRQILERKPDSEDRMEYFLEIRNKIDPSRTDISTWVELIDLEEGRV